MNSSFFYGVVEDRMDPALVGRVRVRVYDYNDSNKATQPTDTLIWSLVMQPTDSSGMSGIGTSPHGIVEGSWVVGTFIDPPRYQMAIILGTIPGYPVEEANPSLGFNDPRTDTTGWPKVITGRDIKTDGSGSTFTESNQPTYPRYIKESDTNRIARGITDTVASRDDILEGVDTASYDGSDSPQFSEKKSTGTRKYPFAKVTETESGHVIEFDDSPGNERIMIFHRSGSFTEILPNGDVVVKTVNDQQNIVSKDLNEYVGRNAYVTIRNGLRILVQSSDGDDATIQVANDGSLNVQVDSGECNVNVAGTTRINATPDNLRLLSNESETVMDATAITHTRGASTVTLTDQEISLSSNGSTLVMNASGITLNGAMIILN